MTVGKPYQDPRKGWTVNVFSGSTVKHRRFATGEEAQAFAEGRESRGGRRVLLTLDCDGRRTPGHRAGYGSAL